MTGCIGTGLLFTVVVGGIYLYMKVSRLNHEIMQSNQKQEKAVSEEQ